MRRSSLCTLMSNYYKLALAARSSHPHCERLFLQALSAMLETMYALPGSCSLSSQPESGAGDPHNGHTTAASAAPDAPVQLRLREACLQHAMPALLKAMRDYTTDNRGDVGSLCAPNSSTVYCFAGSENSHVECKPVSATPLLRFS
jgi:hypothetical protein